MTQDSYPGKGTQDTRFTQVTKNPLVCLVERGSSLLRSRRVTFFCRLTLTIVDAIKTGIHESC